MPISTTLLLIWFLFCILSAYCLRAPIYQHGLIPSRINTARRLHTKSFPLSRCIINMASDSSASLSISVPSIEPSSPKGASMIFLDKATGLFPLWVIAFSVLGWMYPKSYCFQSFAPLITPALAFTMFTMGITLTIDDFKNVVKNWRCVLIGFIAQYSIMPFLGALISRICGLPPEMSVGLILVGCSPGGTASNLVSLIAQADVALSVMMTTVSTVAAVIMTPLLVAKLAGSYVNIPVSGLISSVLNVVLAPVIAGLIFNTTFPTMSSMISSYTPFLSVIFVAMICGTVSATSSIGTALSAVVASKLLLAVTLLHSFGFALGYAFARFTGAEESSARTISIETGMQNSALATVLAKHFPSPQLTALPGVFSATCHSVIGSLLAALWRKKQAAK